MTARQRNLSSLKGKPADRICWSPFLAIYREHQHREIQEKGIVKFLEEIGADTHIRGAENILPVNIHYGKSRIRMSSKGREICKTYETPAGEINEVWIQAPGTYWRTATAALPEFPFDKCQSKSTIDRDRTL